MIKLGSSLAWCQEERSYWEKFIKIDWGVVHPVKYDNTTYSAIWYAPTNWNDKPFNQRIKILVEARVGQSMLGRYKNPPFQPFPTMANYTDRVFKKKMDAIQGAGQFLDIPWTDYKGIKHYIKF